MNTFFKVFAVMCTLILMMAVIGVSCGDDSSDEDSSKSDDDDDNDDGTGDDDDDNDDNDNNDDNDDNDDNDNDDNDDNDTGDDDDDDDDDTAVGPPTYFNFVRGFNEDYCTYCHTTPPQGGAPYALETYQQVIDHLAIYEKRVVTDKTMPNQSPYPTQTEIDLIETWIKNGTPQF